MSESLQRYDYADEEPIYQDKARLWYKINSYYCHAINSANRHGETRIDPHVFGSAIMSGAKFVDQRKHKMLGMCNYYEYSNIADKYPVLHKLLGVLHMGIYIGRTYAIPVATFAGKRPGETWMGEGNLELSGA